MKKLLAILSIFAAGCGLLPKPTVTVPAATQIQCHVLRAAPNEDQKILFVQCNGTMYQFKFVPDSAKL